MWFSFQRWLELADAAGAKNYCRGEELRGSVDDRHESCWEVCRESNLNLVYN